MKISFVGSLTDIFLESELSRTADRIFTELTNTAATRSLNHAHRAAIFSVCCLAIVSFHSGTSFNKFWNINRTLRPLDNFWASVYISSKTSIITGHIRMHSCSMYSRLASTKMFKLSIYDRLVFFYQRYCASLLYLFATFLRLTNVGKSSI